MLQHRSSRVLFFLIIILLIDSCSSPAPTNPPFLPTETISPSATAAATEAAATETATTLATLTPALERSQYVIDIQMNYTSKAADVTQTITYPNWTGETLTNLVLAVEPNLWSGGFTLKSATVDDQAVTNFKIENLNQRLEIPLPAPLEPGRTAVVKLNYGLILPPMQAYNNATNDVRPQIYGYSEKQTNLVDWYPLIVHYQPGQGWILHNPWFYGEHSTVVASLSVV